MQSYAFLANSGNTTFSLAEVEQAKQSDDPSAQYLWLVPERVGFLLDHEGLDTDRANDLISVGASALVKAVDRMPDDTEHVKAYLRKSIDRSLWDYADEDGLLRASARTERRRRSNGKETRRQYSLDDLLTENPACELDDEIDDFAAKLVATSDEQIELVECYEYMYSLCRDDQDRAVLEARWDGGICLMRPPHIETIARQTNLSKREVRKRLTRICRRYAHELNLSMPKGPIKDGVL